MFDWWWRVRHKRNHVPRYLPPEKAWTLDNPLSRALARRLLRTLRLQPGMRVLDVGAGPGRVTLLVAKAIGSHGEVMAIDAQPEMLQRVVERAARERLTNVRPLCGEVGRGVLDGQIGFDRALLISVLGETPLDLQAPCFVEIYRALRPGGLLLVSEHMLDPDYRSPEYVRRVAETAGFDDARLSRRLVGYEMTLRKSAA